MVTSVEEDKVLVREQRMTHKLGSMHSILWDDFINTERNVKIYLVIKPPPLVLVKYHMTIGLEKPQAA